MSIDKPSDYIRLIASNDEEEQRLSFLHAEGLELLAAYGRIKSEEVRLAILELVKTLESCRSAD